MSPFFKVPFCTNTVTITPRPLSRRDSITVPLAGVVTDADNSITSACNEIASNKSSIP